MTVDIRDIIARRSDLGTFLVHLTRGRADARRNLELILTSGRLDALNPFGSAVQALTAAAADTDTQRCVCFTETPLEHVHLLLAEIVGRAIQFEPYGVAFPKKIGRKLGVNPVWYLDTTPGAGRIWLTHAVNQIVDEAIAAAAFPGSAIERLAPFIEQMGTWGGHRKEFWWEREWRHCGNLQLPERVIILCPEDEHDAFKRLLAGVANPPLAAFVDPRWGLEQIISRLAGFTAADTDML